MKTAFFALLSTSAFAALAELNDDQMFGGVATFLAQMGDGEFDNVDQYYVQIMDEHDKAGNEEFGFAQLGVESDNDYAQAAAFLAQLSNEELYDMADEVEYIKDHTLTQVEVEADEPLGAFWDHASVVSPAYAQVMANEMFIAKQESASNF